MLTLKDIVDFMDPKEHSPFLEVFKIRFKEQCQKICINNYCEISCNCICSNITVKGS